MAFHNVAFSVSKYGGGIEGHTEKREREKVGEEIESREAYVSVSVFSMLLLHVEGGGGRFCLSVSMLLLLLLSAHTQPQPWHAGHAIINAVSFSTFVPSCVSGHSKGQRKTPLHSPVEMRDRDEEEALLQGAVCARQKVKKNVRGRSKSYKSASTKI